MMLGFDPRIVRAVDTINQRWTDEERELRWAIDRDRRQLWTVPTVSLASISIPLPVELKVCDGMVIPKRKRVRASRCSSSIQVSTTVMQEQSAQVVGHPGEQLKEVEV